MSSHSVLPAASVILPVYNCRRYLAAAISSILDQTFTDFELLLLDDGSTDGSSDIMRSFAANDPRCITWSRENRGLVYTLNEGIDRSRAEILFRMDGDDISLPDRFERQMSYLMAHPECVAVGTESYLTDPEGCRLRPFTLPYSHEEIDGRHLRGLGGAIVHPSVALRKSAVVAAGGYRDAFRHAEDLDLFLRLAEKGRLANLPDILFEYRQHMGSIGHHHAGPQRSANRRAVIDAKLRRGIGQQPDALDVAKPMPKATKADIHRKWAWWALSAGNVGTARKHAWNSMRYAPLAPKTLHLMACVLRGY